MYKLNIFFLNIYMHVGVYIWIINIHSTHIYYVYKTFILEVINHDKYVCVCV